MPLQPPIAQDDFAAGMVRVAPHLVPSNGAWRLRNMLLDDDGSAYKRGGTTAKSNAPFGSGLRFLWDGELAAGHRTVFASPTSLGALDADDATPINFGVGGIATPLRPAIVDGILFVGQHAYAGSRKTAIYNTGTVAVTQDSTTVVGTGTAWAANLDVGSILVVNGRLMAVRNVTDDTHLELYNPWSGGTLAGQAYSAEAVPAIPAAYHPNGIYGVAGNRLLSAEGDRVYESAPGDSSTWVADEYQAIPDGEHVVAIEGLGDQAFVFTTGGVWLIGNLAFDLTDAFGNTQQQLQRYSGEFTLWQATGIAFWENALIVPAVDGVWLISTGAPPQLLTKSIGPLYDHYVRGGYTAGLAGVFKGHYLLPVMSSGIVDSVLVCRLDRPVELRRLGRVWPWTQWDGAGGKMAALAARYGQGLTPQLLGAEQGSGARVVSFPAFQPDGPAYDHDGSAPTWEVVTRDIATGPLNLNHVKKAQVRYELIARDTLARITGAYGTDRRPLVASWGTALWGADDWTDADDAGFTNLSEVAPEDEGENPFKWRINKRTRYFRLRLKSSDPATRAVVRSVELFVRPSGRM